jgi:MFS family permease
MTGTNAVIYYATTLFSAELGFSSTLSYILAGCLQFTLVIGSLICSYSVDRFGRRPLLLISAALTSISMGCLAGTVSNPNNTSALKAGTFFVFFFETCYCIGFLGIPFLYASEIAPVHLRAAVCGISTAISWLFNYLVAEITPVGFSSLGWKYFFIYMATNAAAGITVYWFFPETAGRSLEEIDEIFTKSKSIFDPVRIAKELPRQHLSTFLHEEAKVDHEIKEGVQDMEHIEDGSEHDVDEREDSTAKKEEL